MKFLFNLFLLKKHFQNDIMSQMHEYVYILSHTNQQAYGTN